MKIYRHSLIFGLSYALDIAGKNNLSHSKSTAYLSVQIGKSLGLDEKSVLSLYYAALLHDIGVSNEYVMYDHCKTGAEMLSKLPLPEEIPLYVLYHHELPDGSGPLGLSGGDIPLGARIICLASMFDDVFGRNASAFDRTLYIDVCGWLDRNRALHSAGVVAAFGELLKREAFLLDYFNAETKYTLSGKGAVSDPVSYSCDGVKKFARCFADIIDQRSPYTYTHSRGIADLAKKAALYLGYDAKMQETMYISGLLHDIGKLNVPVGILHKNGGLTPEERFEINKHTYYTRKILEQIEGFEEITGIAANHHEKTDGTGYPYRLCGAELTEPQRVMAVCDVYQALSEERPYRTRMPEQQVWDIIGGMAENGHLDGRLAGKLRNAFSASAVRR